MKLKNKKTGEIVSLQGELTYDDKVRLLTHYNSLAELNEEWEDYEESKDHYYIDYDGDIMIVEALDYEPKIEEMKQIGNYFKTKEEAEKAVEKLKAWKRLKDKGFKLSAVVDNFFCLDIFMKGEPYEAIKDDLKIVFGG